MNNTPKINLSDYNPAECDTCHETFHGDDLICNEAGQWCEDCYKANEQAERDYWAGYFGIRPGQQPPIGLRGAAGDYDRVSKAELIRRGDAA